MTTFCATMNITKKIALALAALTVASFPLATEGCNGHSGRHHHAHEDHHLQNSDEDCSEENAVHEDGFSNSAVGRRLVSPIRCDTAEPSVAMLRKIPSIMARWKERVGANRHLQTEIISIPVHFHIIKKDDGSGGEVSNQQILDQITKMNTAYSETFVFTLAGKTTTLNSSWYTTSVGSQSELDMKTALKVGGTNTLNIYTVDPSSGALGWATYVVGATADVVTDGVVVLYSTLPGGSADGYNKGATAVHEAGHWLGLLHTFEGKDCSGLGDRVDDTPQQSVPTNGCPTESDTCPGEGADPIHNFMDYSTDICMTEFTAGQYDLMRAVYADYRFIDTPDTPGPTPTPPTPTPTPPTPTPPSPSAPNGIFIQNAAQAQGDQVGQENTPATTPNTPPSTPSTSPGTTCRGRLNDGVSCRRSWQCCSKNCNGSGGFSSRGVCVTE